MSLDRLVREDSQFHLTKPELAQSELIAGAYGSVFESYSYYYDSIINSGLRSNGPISKFLSRKINQMISALDEVPVINRKYVVYRGSNGFRYSVGTSISDRGFSSKTLTFGFGSFIDFQGCCLLRIEYPPGTKQILISSVSKTPHEEEILTYPNEEFYVESERIYNGIQVYYLKFIRYRPLDLVLDPEVDLWVDRLISPIYPQAAQGFLILVKNGIESFYPTQRALFRHLAELNQKVVPWSEWLFPNTVYDFLTLQCYSTFETILVPSPEFLYITNNALPVDIELSDGRIISSEEAWSEPYLIWELLQNPNRLKGYLWNYPNSELPSRGPLFHVLIFSTGQIISSLELTNQILLGQENHPEYSSESEWFRNLPKSRPLIDLSQLTQDVNSQYSPLLYETVKTTLQIIPLNNGQEIGRGIDGQVLAKSFSRIPEPVVAEKIFRNISYCKHEAQVMNLVKYYPAFAYIYGYSENIIRMEYIPGDTMKNVLPGLDSSIFLRIFTIFILTFDQTEFLEYNHRDLHGENIMLKDINPQIISWPEGKLWVDLLPKIIDQGYANTLEFKGKSGNNNPGQFIPLRDLYGILTRSFLTEPKLYSDLSFLLDFFGLDWNQISQQRSVDSKMIPPERFWTTSVKEYLRYLREFPIFTNQFV